MSHFEELSQLYDTWHKQWFEDYIKHRHLIFRIASKFSEFIGSPSKFSGTDNGGSAKQIPDVSAAKAARQPDDQFTLALENTSDIDFEPDGSFYFGICTYMEFTPNTYPKYPCWFLMHGKFHGDYFNVTVKRTSEDFKLRFDDDAEMQRLCEHLLEQLKLEMAESPLRRRSPEPTRIGLGPPPGSNKDG